VTVYYDPEEMELKAAEKYVSFKDKDVLEIGCGEGRFTSKYFEKTRSTIAIDSDPDAIRKAESSFKISPSHRNHGVVTFREGDAEDLEFPSESFDVVIFSWSLCCVADPLKSLREAHRVLRSQGTILNLMPDALPTFETGTIQKMGGKDAIYQGSLNGFRALVDSVQEGLFLPFEEQRVIFHTYFDDMVDFIGWLPTRLGPFTKEEFESISKKSVETIKNYVSSYLIRDGGGRGGLLLKDALIVSKSTKRQ
jgi:SAM-dependent methyltransferase